MKKTSFIFSLAGMAGGILVFTNSPVSAQGNTNNPEIERNLNDPGRITSETDMSPSKLTATIHSLGDSTARGTVEFVRQADKIRVMAKISGLIANEKYTVRVHQLGEASNNADSEENSSTDPEATAPAEQATDSAGTTQPDPVDETQVATADKPQSIMDETSEEGTDLGVITVDGDGNGRLEAPVHHFDLTSGDHGLLGHAVVFYKTSGEGVGAEKPVAVGVIGLPREMPNNAGGESNQSTQPNTGDIVDDTTNQPELGSETETDQQTTED